MSEDGRPLAARVVVALNLLHRDVAALELAAGLAARRQAPLLALFVEDLNLANLAALPFAREVGRLSAAERKLEGPRLQRAVRTHIEKIQRLLEELNRSLRIETDFKSVRGHFMPAVFAEAAQVDFLFLSRRCDTEVPGRTVSGTPRWAPIWAVYDGSPDSERALRLGLEFAEPDASGLCVTVPAESDIQFEALRARALALCPGPAAPRFFRAEPADGAKLRRQIRQTGCRLLVIRRCDTMMLGSLAEAAECPVVLV